MEEKKKKRGERRFNGKAEDKEEEIEKWGN